MKDKASYDECYKSAIRPIVIALEGCYGERDEECYMAVMRSAMQVL